MSTLIQRQLNIIILNKKVLTSQLVVMAGGGAGWMLNTWKMKCVTVSWNSHHTAMSSYYMSHRSGHV